MKAAIKTYKTNAGLTVGEDFYNIDWDGMEFDTQSEYNDWLDEVLAPAQGCDNYDEIRFSLENVTDYLRPTGIRAAVFEALENLDDDYLANIIIMSHKTNSHEVVEVSPSGAVNIAEYPDNNSRSYIHYPDQPVAQLYDIHQASAEACGCDVCRVYRDLDELTEEEFVEKYDQETYDYYAYETDKDAAILEQSHDGGYYEDAVRLEMQEAVRAIPYGYFDDEK